MNDFGMIQNFIEGLSSNEVLKGLKVSFYSFVVFAILNILAIGFNIFTQFKLKMKEKDILKFTLREEKRIQIITDLYKKLEELKYYTGPQTDDPLTYIAKCHDINRFLSVNRIYLNKNYILIMNEAVGYYTNVFNNLVTRSYEMENEYIEKFAEEFNR